MRLPANLPSWHKEDEAFFIQLGDPQDNVCASEVFGNQVDAIAMYIFMRDVDQPVRAVWRVTKEGRKKVWPESMDKPSKDYNEEVW